jgi:hypothetical protein
MHRVVLAALGAALVCLTGCGLNAEEKALVGQWSFDPAGFKATMIEEMKKKSPDTPAEQLGMAADMAMSSISMEIEFKDDRTCTMTMKMGGNAQNFKGKWKFSGGKYQIETTEKDGKPARDEKPITATLKDDKLTIEAGDAPKMPMVRKK